MTFKLLLFFKSQKKIRIMFQICVYDQKVQGKKLTLYSKNFF